VKFEFYKALQRWFEGTERNYVLSIVAT